MTLDRAVLVFAGSMTLLSLVLTYFVHPAWMLLTLFVGLNLIQSAFTGFCPVVRVLKTLGFKPGAAFD
jgi:hypothetical protein